MSKIQYNDNLCPECRTSTIVRDEANGQIVCYCCGLVIEPTIIDSGPDWRAYGQEEIAKKVRVGAPTTLSIHDKGLSTIIGWKDKDAFGKSISPGMKSQLYRLRKWNSRTLIVRSIDRNLALAMNELDRLSSQIRIPKDRKETAAYFYRKMVNRKLIRGRSIEGMLIASLLISCKLNRVPKTLDDFMEYTSVDKKRIAKCYRLIVSELKIHIPNASSIALIPRFCADLKVSGKTQSRSVNIIRKAEKQGVVSGKTPAGLAGASIYIAAIFEGERRTQKEISLITGVTEATIRNRYKEIVKKFNYPISAKT